MITDVPQSSMSLIRPVTFAEKAGTSAPVVAFSFTRRCTAVPFTDVKAPAMMTAVPPGATTIDVISASTSGAKAVSMTPVVALNATMWFRA